MPSSPIRAEVQVPSHVMVPRGRKKVSIEVVALIHNDGADHYVMGAADPSQVHTWQILDDQSKEVARQEEGRPKKVRGATSAYCSTLVPSGLSLREHETLAVDASKLRDGGLYTVRHVHWGHAGEARFVAVVEPERAAAKKTAKKAKKTKKTARKAKAGKVSKKTARKGAKKAARKAAGKKTARKR